MTLTFAKRLALLLVGSALVGCAPSEPVKPLAVEPDLVSLRIAQSAEKASKALDEIAGIEQQRAPAMPAEDDYSSAPPALSQTITVKWTGPVEQMLETLASRAGMRFTVQGNRSGAPLLVNVNVYQKSMIEVLHDLGLQIGRRADVTVNGSLNVIELRYAPVDRT